MSSTTTDPLVRSGAERAFRDAFERLKAGKPHKLAKGSRVSQNNVAKEAGCDPSALKKSRFPALVCEIQEWLRDHPASDQLSNQQKILDQRKKNRETRDRINEIARQRDHLSSLLVQADSKILELSKRVALLEALLPANVISLNLLDNA
jgi:hypothetical protein